MFEGLKRRRFLFEELVKRDFKKKYKRTILGMGWSMLSPLLMLLVMKIVFEQFFGRTVDHYTTYLFCGLLVFNWFSESTSGGMRSLFGNSGIFTKFLTLLVFFAFCALDHVPFTWRFLFLLYPIATHLLFSVGIGMVLSALFVFFRDIDYLWSVALQLLMYGSAIFYLTDTFPPKAKFMFALNPVYRHIAYFRQIVLSGSVPSLEAHLTLLGFAVAAFLAGAFMYKRYNTKFLYYV